MYPRPKANGCALLKHNSNLRQYSANLDAAELPRLFRVLIVNPRVWNVSRDLYYLLRKICTMKIIK